MLAKIKEKSNRNLLCSALLLFFVIFPYLVVVKYASPSADDFTNINNVLNQANPLFLGKVIRASINTYKGWQGTYTGVFLCFLGSGIYQKFGIFGLHLEYFCNIVFFFLSVCCVVGNIVKKLKLEKKEFLSLTFVITSLLSFIILYNYDVSEVFYWHTGLTVYTIPLCFSLLTLAFLLKNELKIWEIVLISFIGFLGAGGSLDISAFVCGVTLLVAVYESLVNKKISNSFVVFIATFVGAIVNVIAPGNYSRHSIISDQFPVLNSIKYSFSGVFKAFWEYIGNGTMILLLLLCFFIFNTLKRTEIKFINPLLLAFILFMGSAIIDFPVYLGYAGGSLPIRCEFVRRVSMAIFVLVVLLDTTGWIATKTDKIVHLSIENSMAVVIAIVISLNACVPIGSWDNVKPFKIYNDIYFNSIDHRLTEYMDATNTILYTLETNPGKDVVINIPSYDSLGYLKSLGLTDDPTFWVNVGIAQYFGNKSIVLNIENKE